MTISLSDLKARRAAMSSGVLGSHAAGLVATHNAADVLIEIAEAALAYRDAPFEDCNACLLRLGEALDKVQP